MLEAGSEIRVQDVKGADAGAHQVRGLKAKGGQGYVYSLRTPRGRPAVLKVPSPKGLFGNEIEIRILKTLPPHKNVVRLLGTTWLQGVECAVLGYGHPNPYQRLNASGVRDATRLYRGAAPKTGLPATTAIELTQEVLAALEHLHTYGFVHGDIKPGNILVELATRDTRIGNREYFEAVQKRAYRTLLADFGSTRSMTFLKEQGQKGKLLAPAEFTPVFAPPEVFRKSGEGDASSGVHSGRSVDVYQVGLLLYQLISGHLPYDHYVPDVAKKGLTAELVQLKRAEQTGEVRCFDPNRLRQSRQGDVVFAEAFASQRLRDRFYDDVEMFVELATRPAPAERPTISELRQEMFRLFELEPPKRSPNAARVQVSVWNPRWHLTRVNRLYEASRAPDNPSNRVSGRGAIQTAPLDGVIDTGRPSTGAETQDLDTRDELGAEGEVPRDALDTVQDAMPGPSRPAWERRTTPRRARRMGPVEPPPAPPLPEPPREARSPTSIYLTPEDAQALRAEASEPEEEEEDVAGLEVALIDDDRVALAVLGRSLRRRGCEVRTFQDPESGLESISRDLPHAAIVDMQMPGISGMELIKRLRRRLNGLPFPVLVLSSVEEEEVLKEAYRHGVRDYLVKPVTEGELSVKLQKAVRESRRENPPAVPRELAGFELQEEVRRGEVALVYTAVDAWQRYADPVKAIKVLRPDVSGDVEPLLKMRREIDVLSRCDHPGLPRLRESGLLGKLLFYVVDEVPGLSLGQRVRAHGPLRAGEVVYLLRDLAEALGYLHTQGMVLGDLTPESVGQGTGRGGWLITDLGCARSIGGVLRLDEPTLPRSRFAAPELFEDPPRLDPRADLYSLGVCALEAYSNTPALRSRASGAIDVPALGVGMPAGLVALLERCVSPRLDERFPNAHALLSELRRLAPSPR